MKLYYFIFTCAYWVSFNDLKERPSSKEYAKLFVSLSVFCILFSIGNSVSIILNKNILSGFVAILGGIIIFRTNHLLFIKDDKYTDIIKRFSYIKKHSYRKKRILVLTVFGGSCLLLLLITSFILSIKLN